MVYEIKVYGVLDESWSNWLGEACIHAERGPDGGVITTLVGDWADQATLFGILDRIRDLNLALLSVTSRGPA